MTYTSSTFISSEFWKERIGTAKVLETLNIMGRTKSRQIITDTGKKIKKNCKNITKANNILIKAQSLDALPNFYFYPKKNLMYKTLITQELLKKKIQSSNAIYCPTAHKEKLLIIIFSQSQIFILLNI
jgi:glutamate-1-semialdehyde 2,1-aminomutase